jgi:hypothetical protein
MKGFGAERMMISRFLGLTLITVLGFQLIEAAPCLAQSAADNIARSHVEANVPDERDFNRFLQRDLQKYFHGKTKKHTIVTFEFLRDGPTQTGVAFPKYYLWVKVAEGNRPLDEGAVRVAAIEKQGFEATHFLTRTEIEKDPKAVFRVFPAPVAEKILSKCSGDKER